MQVLQSTNGSSSLLIVDLARKAVSGNFIPPDDNAFARMLYNSDDHLLYAFVVTSGANRLVTFDTRGRLHKEIAKLPEALGVRPPRL